jgi:hypothetical protein
LTAKEELVAGLKWMLDTSEDNADYIAQLIIRAVKEAIEQEMEQQSRIVISDI